MKITWWGKWALKMFNTEREMEYKQNFDEYGNPKFRWDLFMRLPYEVFVPAALLLILLALK